jgi:hypothetical protein
MKNTRTSLLCKIAIVDGLIKQVVNQKNLQGATSSRNSMVAELNQTMSDLEISKQGLYDELAKLDFMKQFADSPWVIKQNPSQPTYYQLVSVVGKVVTLARKGKSTLVGLANFNADYVEAKEAEVLQHVKYLTDNGITFLYKPVPCNTDEIPIIDFSGGSDVLKAIAPEPVKKPKNADFFMVTLKQGYGSKVYHESFEIAEAEAIRLSKQENKKAYVLGVVAEIETVPTTTYEIKTKKF